VAKVFLAQPCYGPIEFESCDAIEQAIGEGSPHEFTPVRMSSSLLANCFNKLLVTCLEAGGFDYWFMVHADVGPTPLAADIMIAELEAYHLDVIHAPCKLKDGSGRTSTAVAYSDDPWDFKRRLTVKELARLWPTFTAGTLAEQLDPGIKVLLPNTGCMLIKLGPWLDNFPGFEIRDRIDRVPVTRLGVTLSRDANTISEDWNFGYWCAANGVKVGGTFKVRTDHVGRAVYSTKRITGLPFDDSYFELTGKTPPAETAVADAGADAA